MGETLDRPVGASDMQAFTRLSFLPLALAISICAFGCASACPVDALLSNSGVAYRPYPRWQSGHEYYQFQSYAELVDKRHRPEQDDLAALLGGLRTAVRRVAILEIVPLEGREGGGYLLLLDAGSDLLFLTSMVADSSGFPQSGASGVRVAIVPDRLHRRAMDAFEHPERTVSWTSEPFRMGGGDAFLYRTWDGADVRKSLMLNFRMQVAGGEHDPMYGESVGVHTAAEALVEIWWAVGDGGRGDSR